VTPSSSPLRIAVLYGGRSAEHDVSVMSATNVLGALDPARYDVLPVHVGRDGRWWLSRVEAGVPAQPQAGEELCLVPGGRGRALVLDPSGAAREIAPIDIVFPVLHGQHGEDGAVQGLAEVAMVPLAGCGILGSATALDKDIAKRLLAAAGLPVARSLSLRAGEAAPSFEAVTATLGQPVFVKPARQGSSVGVSRAGTAAEWEAALAEGFRHDDLLLVEEFIQGREVECAVLERPEGGVIVSRPGEIVPAASHGFYSYDAKYVDAEGAALKIPAELPEGQEARLQEMAGAAFRALGCDGMARVDFFVTAEGRALVNEVNTIPGFTDISMYSKVMEVSGIGYAELIDRLVAHGLARAARVPDAG